MNIDGVTERLRGQSSIQMQSTESQKWPANDAQQTWELPKVRYSQSVALDKLSYKYSVRDDDREETIWESNPVRELKILPSELYKTFKTQARRDGALLSMADQLEWQNMSQVFLVNGHIEKTDTDCQVSLAASEDGQGQFNCSPQKQQAFEQRV